MILRSFTLLVIGLVIVFSSVPRVTSQIQRRINTQCVPELTARKQAESMPLPVYPEDEAEPGSSQGVVFAIVLFNQEGLKSKVRIYETPNAECSEAVKKALDHWKLRKLYNSELSLLRLALAFGFISSLRMAKAE